MFSDLRELQQIRGVLQLVWAFNRRFNYLDRPRWKEWDQLKTLQIATKRINSRAKGLHQMIRACSSLKKLSLSLEMGSRKKDVRLTQLENFFSHQSKLHSPNNSWFLKEDLTSGICGNKKEFSICTVTVKSFRNSIAAAVLWIRMQDGIEVEKRS